MEVEEAGEEAEEEEEEEGRVELEEEESVTFFKVDFTFPPPLLPPNSSAKAAMALAKGSPLAVSTQAFGREGLSKRTALESKIRGERRTAAEAEEEEEEDEIVRVCWEEVEEDTIALLPLPLPLSFPSKIVTAEEAPPKAPPQSFKLPTRTAREAGVRRCTPPPLGRDPARTRVPWA